MSKLNIDIDVSMYEPFHFVWYEDEEYRIRRWVGNNDKHTVLVFQYALFGQDYRIEIHVCKFYPHNFVNYYEEQYRFDIREETYCVVDKKDKNGNVYGQERYRINNNRVYKEWMDSDWVVEAIETNEGVEEMFHYSVKTVLEYSGYILEYLVHIENNKKEDEDEKGLSNMSC